MDDSKQLSKEDRQRFYDHIIQNNETYAWSIVCRTNEQVDNSESVLEAALGAIEESIEILIRDKLPTDSRVYCIVDGHKTPSFGGGSRSFPCRPWKGGDAAVYTVALASVLARVTRDNIMEQAAKEYPMYGFDNHGGYASREHTLILHRYGPSPIHRRSNRKVKCRENSSFNNGVTTRGGFTNSLLAAAIVLPGILPLLLPTSRASATMTNPQTGIVLPDVGEIEAAVPKDWNDVDNLFNDGGGGDQKSLFSRLDSTDDFKFYNEPRFVNHVDDQAVQVMTDYISNVAIQPDTRNVLDLCSSWTSHISMEKDRQLLKVSGLGMNVKELDSNSVLSDWTVQDLNSQPILPYRDNTFDTVLCQLSIDYLTHPLQVCREIGRCPHTRYWYSSHNLFQSYVLTKSGRHMDRC